MKEGAAVRGRGVAGPHHHHGPKECQPPSAAVTCGLNGRCCVLLFIDLVVVSVSLDVLFVKSFAAAAAADARCHRPAG